MVKVECLRHIIFTIACRYIWKHVLVLIIYQLFLSLIILFSLILHKRAKCIKAFIKIIF